MRAPGILAGGAERAGRLRKIDIEAIKSFISKTVDSYRAAYGRRVEDHPRQCVFIGTTNSAAFLRDDTGNRRFWPVRLGDTDPRLTVWGDLTQPVIDQMWAEAVALYGRGSPLRSPGSWPRAPESSSRNLPRTTLGGDWWKIIWTFSFPPVGRV